MITNAGTDHNLSITNAARETTLTGQDHMINLNIAEAPATTRDTHPTPYSTTTAAHNTHLRTETLSNTPTGTPHTVTDTAHP